METLYLYSGKVILTSAVLYLYYQLFLKDKTFHHYNRFYLLAIMVISIMLPLLKVSYFTLKLNSDIYLLLNNIQNINTSKNTGDDFIYYKIGALFIGLVAFFFLTKLLYGLVKIQVLKKKFRKENFEGINFYQTNLEEAPFSFFKNLFWKDSILMQSDLGRQILKHEMVHIEQKHSWDKIFLELATSLFWFNPFFYLIKKEIHLIHEYLADKKALKNSDTKAFAQMLLASHFSGKQLPATSPFLSSNLKKRLTMLKKSKTKFSYARRILALPLLFSLAFIYMVKAKNKEINNTNMEIQQMISNLKSDTLAPPPPPPPPTPPAPESNGKNPPELEELQAELARKEKALLPMNEVLQLKNEEVKKIGEKMKAKSAELQKLSKNQKFNDPKFKILEKELSELGTQIDHIYGETEFKQQMKLQEKSYADLDQLYAKLDQYYNSAEFLAKIKNEENIAREVERKINSPQVKRQLKNAERQAKDVEKKNNSPAFKKQIKDAELKAMEAEKIYNSPEFKLRIKNAEEISNKSNPPISPPQVRQQVISSQDSSFKWNDKSLNKVDKRSTLKEEALIFIEGKISTSEEMQQLDPNKIESVNVIKKGFEGKEKGEIHIKLKK